MIIAFTGPKGCGKSSASKYLIKKGFVRHYFAKPLKEMIKCLGLTEEHVNGSTDFKEAPCKELCGKSPRWGMQSLGTEWGRELIHPNLWANAWANTMPKAHVTCDDLRFPNELKLLREKGGIIINIVRENCNYDKSHESEAHELPYDYQITNSGSMEDMHDQLEKILREEGFEINWWVRLRLWLSSKI